MEVAFTKNAQPTWLRILKYAALAAILYFFWGAKLLKIILFSLFTSAFLIHFWFRYKTKGWTQSYGLWKHDKDKVKSVN
jgi:hypothetical protein